MSKGNLSKFIENIFLYENLFKSKILFYCLFFNQLFNIMSKVDNFDKFEVTTFSSGKLRDAYYVKQLILASQRKNLDQQWSIFPAYL